MTFEDEFQKPVRDRLAEIVIPELPSYKDWPQHTVLETDYGQWLIEAQAEADVSVTVAGICFDDIARGVHGSIHGQFPTPTPRKRKRVRNKK